MKLQPWMKVTEGIHHLHIRKRVHKEFAEYPNKDKWIRFVDEIAFISGIFGQLMTLPQLYIIWILHQASGVSLVSWSAYAVNAVVWLIYGLVHKAKPIITIYCIWIIMDILIVIGIMLYG